MGAERTADERERARAAADAILAGPTTRAGGVSYRAMARGTLAALDWVERRRDVAPSTNEVRAPHDIVVGHRGYESPAMTVEIGWAEDWGSGYVRPPREDLHFHGAVWALLQWWEAPNDASRTLSIDVPGMGPF